LSLEEIKDIVLQAKELGIRTVSIAGEGEPFLYKPIKELIAFIDKKGLIPTIYSNCTLIEKRLAKFLLEHNVQIIGKQNSLDLKKQDSISKVEGAAKKMLIGMNNLIETGFTDYEPTRLGVHTVVLKENIKELPGMWRAWRRKNISPQVQINVYPPKEHGKEYFKQFEKSKVSAKELRALFEELARIDKEEFEKEWNPKTAYPIADSGCAVHYGSAAISQKGNVIICGYLQQPLGNIREKKLKEILNSEEVKKIRNVGASLNYPGGRYGCRLNAFNMTGDRFGPDPLFDEFLKTEKNRGKK